MTIAAVIAMALSLQPAPGGAAGIPDSCPRLVLSFMSGYPTPSTALEEIGSTVVVALWDSGELLRAEDPVRPFGAPEHRLVLGRRTDRIAHSEPEPSAELVAIRRHLFDAALAGSRRIAGRIDPDRWSCAPTVP
jgi:hypothetical protein